MKFMFIQSALNWFFFILLMLLAPACNKNAGSSNDNLIREISFGQDGRTGLMNPTFMASDKKDHIYISDPFLSGVFHYDLNGKL